MTEERRPYLASDYRSVMGRTTVKITCPFCSQDTTAYVWSLAGSGKRCACGAKFTPHAAVKTSPAAAGAARRPEITDTQETAP